MVNFSSLYSWSQLYVSRTSYNGLNAHNNYLARPEYKNTIPYYH